MSQLDWVVLVGALGLIVVYGVWRGGRNRDIGGFLLAGKEMRWGTVALSIMATQASAITFLSTPGQAYADGMRFVQFYLGLPLAMIVLSITAVPLYHRLKVYTAYEYLERRFDVKTRALTAFLFLIQRGLAAGLTIYAPALILSVILGWDMRVTILVIGGLVVIYTASGGTRAVSRTQVLQAAIILVGMVAAFVVLVASLPADVSFVDALRVAGGRAAQRDRSFVQPHEPLHLLVGADRRVLPAALVLRHRPVAGAALPHRPVGDAEPARAALQRHGQGPDAVRDPAAGSHGVRVLPVRGAADLLQPRSGRQGAELRRTEAGSRPSRNATGRRSVSGSSTPESSSAR